MRTQLANYRCLIECNLPLQDLSKYLTFVWLFIIISASFKSAADIPNYEDKVIDLANCNIASLYKQDDKGAYELIGIELNNLAAAELYSAPGRYQLKLPFRLKKHKEDVWLQVRGEQVFNIVTLNDQLVSDEYRPLTRLLLNRSVLSLGLNHLTIEFIVSKQTPKFVFRDIILAKQNVLYQQSVQYSVASMTYGVLFTLVGILLTCIYFVFFQHSVVFFSAIFYYFSGASALLVGLFWLDELGLFVYGYYLDLLNFMIGMSFLLLNLSLTDTSLTQKTAVGIAACFIAIFLSYPTFFVFSCVALFTISLMNFRNVSLFVLVLLVATIVATTIDNFNLLDSYIQNFSSAVARSFLYQLDYLALSLFAFYLLVLCSTKWKKKTLLNRQLVIQKKNLEIQLINKHIQPHFLMNALMSIQQQIENSPSNAIEMIDLLSQDFQLLHKQMGKSVIPLQEEIDICKGLCHLMEKTQVAKYKLLLSGNDLLIEIPPGLLFTLIENGIKHGYTGRNNGIFFITCAVKNKTLFICVENDGRSKNETYPCSGLGLHYVKEQLEAWKPNQWSFEAGPSELGWKNIITVSYFDGNIVQ